ncbi:hypothetical protein LWI29_005272 [Acer saccharum]|uniref:Retrovirus-related Pol polyprotein from transposon TNT 1-94-like beta-barrel domain-containing protein n=1 Tax=Acer saccharum TaxID=4024 RepID=A0AA39SPY8_ACESA|nr:hypothetical protein LWI29_005272 [Acer saccharum]
MYGYRNRPRKTLEKHVVKNVVDDLLAKSCVVPHSTMLKKVDNALLDIFENVTNEVMVHVKKPNVESKHVSGKSERHVVKSVWLRKDTYNCLVAQYALHANSSYSWYLDSSCSRNMTGNKEFFKNLVLKDGGWVTFGNGTKKQVLGKGTIFIPGLPKLRNTLACEKTSLPLKRIDRRFQSAARPPFTTVEWLLRKVGEQWWFQSAVSKPPNQPHNQIRGSKSIRHERRFRTAVVAAYHNRRITSDLSGLKQRFPFGGQATDKIVDSPEMVKPGRSQVHSP